MRPSCPRSRRLPSSPFEKSVPWLRHELIADVIAKAYEAFVRLMELSKADLAFPTVLANFAIRQVRGGRQVGCRQNIMDVMSRHAQRRKGFSVLPLREQNDHGHWEELVVEDRKATPAEVAAFKVDFATG